MKGTPASQLLGHRPGLSRPLLDYWARTGLLVPTGPAGTYTSVEVAAALVLADAHRLGAPGPVLAAVLAALAGDPLAWPTALWIDPDGGVHETEPLGPAWLLRPRERACDQVSLAIAS